MNKSDGNDDDMNNDAIGLTFLSCRFFKCVSLLWLIVVVFPRSPEPTLVLRSKTLKQSHRSQPR